MVNHLIDSMIGAIGNLFSTIYYVDDIRMDKLLANIFDILGLIALIIAVMEKTCPCECLI